MTSACGGFFCLQVFCGVVEIARISHGLRGQARQGGWPRVDSAAAHVGHGLLRQFLDQREAEMRQGLGAMLYVVQVCHPADARDQQLRFVGQDDFYEVVSQFCCQQGVCALFAHVRFLLVVEIAWYGIAAE